MDSIEKQITDITDKLVSVEENLIDFRKGFVEDSYQYNVIKGSCMMLYVVTGDLYELRDRLRIEMRDKNGL